MRFPRTAGELFSEAMGGTLLGKRLRDAEIWRVWPEVVGKTIAIRATPVRIINGTLTVAVSSGPWMQELSFMKEMIREKLNLALEEGEVSEIIFRSGKISAEIEPAMEEETAEAVLTDSEVENVTALASSIADADTRTVFSELMKSALNTRRRGSAERHLTGKGREE